MDDPIIKYYPEFHVHSRFDSEDHKRITFRNLLSHASGLPREAKIGGVFDGRDPSWEEHCLSISGCWFRSPPGEVFSYSNAGFDLTVFVLERVTGESYPDYLQKVLGDKLGINPLFSPAQVAKLETSSKGHYYSGSAAPGNLAYGCGSVFLPISEQVKLNQFLLNKGAVNGEQLLAAKYIDLMKKDHFNTGYGLGTELSEWFGEILPNHAGGGFGQGSQFIWSPEHGFGIVVFFNNEDSFGPVSDYVKKTIKKLLKAKGIDTSRFNLDFRQDGKIAVSLEHLATLAGFYSGYTGELVFTLAEGKLVHKLDDKNIYLIPHSETRFSAEDNRFYEFMLEEGRPRWIHYYNPASGGYWFAYRPELQEEAKKSSDWKKYQGVYRYNLYKTLALYEAIKYDDGYLYYLSSKENQLFPVQGHPGTFYMANGDSIIFEDGMMYNAYNVPSHIIDSPLADLEKIKENDPNSPLLLDWQLDMVAGVLKKLERNAEANNVLKLKEKSPTT